MARLTVQCQPITVKVSRGDALTLLNVSKAKYRSLSHRMQIDTYTVHGLQLRLKTKIKTNLNLKD